MKVVESEIPLHKNTIVKVWVKCVQNYYTVKVEDSRWLKNK